MKNLKFRVWFKKEYPDFPEDNMPGRMVHFDRVGYCDEYNHLSFQLRKEDRDPNGGGYSNLCMYEGDYSEPMQFTGMSDHNGVEIYEGDILKHPGSDDAEDRGPVFWSVRAGWYVNIEGHEYELWDCVEMSGMVVVGNTYELKEKNNGNPNRDKGVAGSPETDREPDRTGPDAGEGDR